MPMVRTIAALGEALESANRTKRLRRPANRKPVNLNPVATQPATKACHSDLSFFYIPECFGGDGASDVREVWRWQIFGKLWHIRNIGLPLALQHEGSLGEHVGGLHAGRFLLQCVDNVRADKSSVVRRDIVHIRQNLLSRPAVRVTSLKYDVTWASSPA
jgi:hypothetical protein